RPDVGRPHFLAVQVNLDSDHDIGLLSPDRPVDLKVHGLVSNGLEVCLYRQGAFLTDDYLYCHLGLLFSLKKLRSFEEWLELAQSILSHRRSEEHTSELQSQSNLVCRLLLEKKNKLLEIDLSKSSNDTPP